MRIQHCKTSQFSNTYKRNKSIKTGKKERKLTLVIAGKIICMGKPREPTGQWELLPLNWDP